MNQARYPDAFREALRILDLWRGGAGEPEGITLELVDWCLTVTGDVP
jgi:hypothetical protein